MKRIIGLTSCLLSSIWTPFVTASNEQVILQRTADTPLPFSSLKGKWVFINYWASWCHPCLDEIPELNHFYKANKQNDMALFAVNFDGLSDEEQTQLIHQFDLKYPSLSQDPGPSLHLKAIRALPVTFVFNPKGEFHEALYGGQTVASLNTYLHDKQPSIEHDVQSP